METSEDVIYTYGFLALGGSFYWGATVRMNALSIPPCVHDYHDKWTRNKNKQLPALGQHKRSFGFASIKKGAKKLTAAKLVSCIPFMMWHSMSWERTLLKGTDVRQLDMCTCISNIMKCGHSFAHKNEPVKALVRWRLTNCTQSSAHSTIDGS
eukprot:1659079-Amphidinium_carterae.1